MAERSLRLFTVSEVHGLLDDQEQFKAKLREFVHLDEESKNEDEPEVDGSWPDGSQVLLEAEVLTPDSRALIAMTLNSPLPAERDSILLLDPELNATGQICVLHEHEYNINSCIRS